MKVLMISIDKGLLGKEQLGDVVQRHKKYGDYCDKLDIIVFSKKGYKKHNISEKVTAYPTNSVFKLFYVKNGFKIAKELFVNNKYDLIVCQEPFLTGWLGYKLKKKFNSKLLVHLHGDFKMPVRKIINNADGIRVMSQGQKDKLINKGIDADKIKVISTPSDLKKFLENKQINKSEKIILHIGRDDNVKDYETLIKAFKIIQEKDSSVQLYQVGADEKIQKAIERVGVSNFKNIVLKKRQDHNQVINLCRMCNVLVLSSKSESFGKVLVEANACGKPVVATATTGAKEIIQDGYNGFLVPIGNAQQLADKVLYLLNNSAKAKEMGENGRKLVKEKYSDNTQKIIQLWQELI